MLRRFLTAALVIPAAFIAIPSTASAAPDKCASAQEQASVTRDETLKKTEDVRLDGYHGQQVGPTWVGPTGQWAFLDKHYKICGTDTQVFEVIYRTPYHFETKPWTVGRTDIVEVDPEWQNLPWEPPVCDFDPTDPYPGEPC